MIPQGVQGSLGLCPGQSADILGWCFARDMTFVHILRQHLVCYTQLAKYFPTSRRSRGQKKRDRICNICRHENLPKAKT